MIQRLFIACFLMTAPVLGSSLNWLTNYQIAVEESQKEGKPLLVFFTGSDWSGWSMKMKKEILDSSGFVDKIDSQFICVQIDFPQHHSLSEEEKEQNYSLKERFEIIDYPRLLILDPAEREIARLGYSPEKGDKFAEDLVQIVEKDQYLNYVMDQLSNTCYTPPELQAFYSQAKELRRIGEAMQILEVGLKSSDPFFFLLEKYRILVEEGSGQMQEAVDLREQLVKLDPENKKGTQFSLALIDFQELAGQKINNPKHVIAPLENYLSKYRSTDIDNVWRIEMMIAQFYLDADESKTALRHAETAYEAAPEEKKPEIEKSLDYIRKQTNCIVERSSSEVP